MTQETSTKGIGPYSELLKMTKEKVKEALIPLRAMQAKKKGEGEILKLDEQILEQEGQIRELASADPIDFGRILDAVDKVEVLKRRRRKFVELLSTLFPESTVVKDAASANV